MKAEEHLILDEHFEAMRVFEHVLKSYSLATVDLRDIYVKLAVQKARLNFFDSAEDDLKTAIGIDPNSPAAYFRLGWIYAIQSRLMEAIEMFKTCVFYDDKHQLCHFNTASLLFFVGNFVESEPYFRSVILTVDEESEEFKEFMFEGIISSMASTMSLPPLSPAETSGETITEETSEEGYQEIDSNSDFLAVRWFSKHVKHVYQFNQGTFNKHDCRKLEQV